MVETQGSATAGTVLIADDDPQILAMVSQRLRQCGYAVIEADTGTRALEETLANRPDVIVLDVLMPGMSGWEVARVVRQDATHSGTGIIVLTAIGHTTNAATSPLFADEFLDKPFEFVDLERTIARVLHKRSR